MDVLSNIFNAELNIQYLAPRNSVGSKPVSHFSCRKGMRQYSRFFYITSGELSFYLPDSQTMILTAKKGDIVFLPNDVEYDSVWKDVNDLSFMAILFNLTDLQNEPFTIYDRLCIMAHDKHEVHLRNFEKLKKTFDDGGFGYKLLCRSLFWQILYDILSDWSEYNYKRKDAIYRGIFYIENNYQNEIDVNELSELCGMCPSSFRKKFKDITGMSPIEYKNYLKTKKAIELLSFGEFNVTEVAEMVGFSDVFYFCKQFKRFWGTTPKKYME